MSTTLDIVCPSCGRTLRIDAEHAGKQVRCPACQTISAAPPDPTQLPAATTAPPAPPTDDAPRWHLRTPEGTSYGPISWSEILTWASEGRIAADCDLASSPDGPWQSAGDLLPVLKANGQSPSTSSQPATSPPPHHGPHAPTTAPYYQPYQPYQPAMTMGAPHRGPLILVFGLLGIIMGCPVFSALAWILGSRDLREMRAGRMDRQGENITLVGMILGMILTVLWLIAAFIILSIALIAIAVNL